MKKEKINVFIDLKSLPYKQTTINGYVSDCKKFFIADTSNNPKRKSYSLFDVDTRALISSWLPTIKSAIEKGEQMYKEMTIEQWNEARTKFKTNVKNYPPITI